MRKEDTDFMKRWMKYVRPYLRYFIFGPICMIVEVIGEVLMPKFLAAILDYGVRGETAQASGMVRWLYENIHASGFVIAVMAAMVFTAVLMMLGGVGGAYFGAKASVNFAADLREDVYRKVQSFSFANIDRFSTASLVTRLTNDVTQLQNFINMLLRMCLRAPGMLIGALVMALLLSPSLSVTLAVTVPLMGVVLAFLIFRGFPRFSQLQTRLDALNSTVQENLTNVRVVKSFVREEYEIEKFSGANRELKRAGFSANGVLLLVSPVMSFFMNVTTMAVLWFGGNKVASATMSVGDLTAFVTYITQILMSLMSVTMIFMMFSRALASGKRIAEVLDEVPDVSDRGSDSSLRVEQGGIEFRDVSFRYYKNSERAVLDRVSFSVAPGETLGIVGSTGCGKSTLISMIPRLYDPDAGEVFVDGHNVREYSLQNLRAGIGVVLQKNLLFSGTVSDNLRWGNPMAEDDQLRSAAARAQADGFVSAFPEGYETDILQGGSNVSGGQRQRLCIARALLKQPKILILDDSTSAVDTATEARIRQAFREELKDSTKIIISQRISSVKDSDRILVINDGCITGIGTHEQLLKSNAEYREIYETQMDGKAGDEDGATA